MLIHDSSELKGKYRLGIVEATNVGNDGRVRSCSVGYTLPRVKDPLGYYTGGRRILVTRSVQRLSLLLPVEEQSEKLEVVGFEVSKMSKNENDSQIIKVDKNVESSSKDKSDKKSCKDKIDCHVVKEIKHAVKENLVAEDAHFTKEDLAAEERTLPSVVRRPGRRRKNVSFC